MSIPCSRNDLERAKFRECPADSGEVVVATQICQEEPIEVTISDQTINVDVNITDNDNIINEFSEVAAVPVSTPTLIVSYTVPMDKVLELRHVQVSGCNTGKWDVEVDGSPIARKRTYYTQYNEEFEFEALKITEGQVVDVIVENCGSTATEFDGRILGDLRDE